MLELKKTEEWAFFLLFLGGILLLVNTLIGIIVFAATSTSLNTFYMHFLDGFGVFTFVAISSGNDNIVYLGAGINLAVGIIALLSGLKLFTKVFYNILTKISYYEKANNCVNNLCGLSYFNWL